MKGKYKGPGYPLSVYVSGNYAYVANSRGLQVINVSNPSSPTLVGFIDTDGIGSRYFSVMNNAQDTSMATIETLKSFGSGTGIDYLAEVPVNYFSPVGIRKDYRVNLPLHHVFPDECGDIAIEIKETQRLEIHLQEIDDPEEGMESTGRNNRHGFLVSGNNLQKFPVGTTFDRSRGIFYWQPGPGFLGEYRFVFFQRDQEGKINKRDIVIRIRP